MSVSWVIDRKSANDLDELIEALEQLKVSAQIYALVHRDATKYPSVLITDKAGNSINIQLLANKLSDGSHVYNAVVL